MWQEGQLHFPGSEEQPVGMAAAWPAHHQGGTSQQPPALPALHAEPLGIHNINAALLRARTPASRTVGADQHAYGHSFAERAYFSYGLEVLPDVPGGTESVDLLATHIPIL